MDFHWSYPFIIGILIILFLSSYATIEFFMAGEGQHYLVTESF